MDMAAFFPCLTIKKAFNLKNKGLPLLCIIEIQMEKHLKNNILVISLFTVIGIFFYLLLIDESNLSKQVQELVLTPETFFLTIIVFNILGFSVIRVNNYWNKKIPMLYEQNKVLGLSLLVVAIYLLLLHFTILILIRWLAGVEPFYAIQSKGVRFMLSTWSVEMCIVCLLLINRSKQYMLTLYREKEKLKEVAAMAKYQALQNQLNPHFLFNSLNTLIAEIQYDPDNAVEFAQKFSDVYRYVLQQTDRQFISVKEELKFLQSYIFLHQVRLGNCLRVERDFPDRVLNAQIPPLTLQLLIENVLKHNYISEEYPMTVFIKSLEDDMVLSISNKVHLKQDVRLSGKGLNNLSERYKFLCGKEIGIQSDKECFTVLIPLIYE